MRVGLIALVFVGCNTDMTYEQYLVGLQHASCQWRVRCHVMPDLETCLRDDPSPPRPELVAGIDAEVVRWHPDAARACLDRIEALTCDTSSPEYRRPLCRDLVTGTLGDGEPCAFATECISRECWMESGLACDDAGCCRGTCFGNEPPRSESVGGRCRYAPCTDAWCDGSACQAFLSEGADCDLDLRNGPRYGEGICDYGLACVETKCRRAVATGEDCTLAACANVADVCGFRKVCQPRQFRGGPCTYDAECASGNLCDATQHCAERPKPQTLPVGAACGFFQAPCAEGAFCDADPRAGDTDGVCTLPKPAGASCLDHEQCASESCSNAGVCLETICL